MTTTTLNTDLLPNGCGCAHCASHDSVHLVNDQTPLHDLVVLPGGGGTVTPASIGVNNAEELLIGMEWGPGGGTAASVTFSFPQSVPSYYPPNAQEQNGFEEFTEDMKTATREILDMIETFANITFTEDTSGNDGDITFGRAWLTNGNSDPGAWAYYPDQGDFSGDVWTNTKYNYLIEDTTKGNVGFFVLLHEVMHSVGLMHSFSAGLTGNEATEQFSVTAYDWSSWGNTFAETYMLYDVAAVQAIYGANMTHNTSDDVYILEPVRSNTIWDAGGIDTIDSSAYSGDVILHLEEGGYSSVGEVEHIAIAYGAVIENARSGAGNDELYGNDVDNILEGAAGADQLFGGAGIDLASYDSNNVGVTVDLNANIISGGDANGDVYTSIEGVLGSAHRDFLYGDNGVNAFLGGAGNDILEGRGGADILSGDAGWDYILYTGSSAGVNVDLTTGTGLGGDAEGDVIEGVESIIGSAHDDTLTGDSGANILKGEFGNDILSGMGGNDLLYGGAGNDDYHYLSGNIKITETSGTDTVIFDAIWDINDVNLVTNTLTFDAWNSIVFNDITKIEWFSFDGLADMTLAELIAYEPPPPPTNDDTFVATNMAETFDGGLGTDTVDFTNSTAGVKVDLQHDTAHDGFAAGDEYDNIENLSGSVHRDWLWGDGGDNALYGMAGNDILEGGAGVDIIDGGDGWDYARYTRSASGVDVNLDTNVNTGGDAAGDMLYNIETLIGSAHEDTLIGTTGSQFLYGMAGTDTLNGGQGTDSLYGGADADVFLFDAITAYTGVDKIYDFSLSDNDVLDLSDLLTGYDPLTDAIEDFVQITDDGTHSTVSVDSAGSGTSFIDIAQVLNTTGLTDESALINSGHLIV